MASTHALTVRDLVTAIQVEVRDSDLLPHRAAELLARLTALLGNILTEIREADHQYSLVLLACYEAEAKANRAKIRAETSPEHLRKREARDTLKVAEEMIGGLKYVIRSAHEEMRLTR